MAQTCQVSTGFFKCLLPVHVDKCVRTCLPGATIKHEGEIPVEQVTDPGILFSDQGQDHAVHPFAFHHPAHRLHLVFFITCHPQDQFISGTGDLIADAGKQINEKSIAEIILLRGDHDPDGFSFAFLEPAGYRVGLVTLLNGHLLDPGPGLCTDIRVIRQCPGNRGRRKLEQL